MFRSTTGNALLQVENKRGSYENFVCQYNPTEMNINTERTYRTVESVNDGETKVQHVSGYNSRMNLTLYFDTSASHEVKMLSLVPKPTTNKSSNVSTYTNKLVSMVQVEGKLHRPAHVIFRWGPIVYKGFAKNIEVKYTQFEKGGMPVRAQVNLVLMYAEESAVDAERNNTLCSPDRTKCVTMTSDSSLWNIAGEEYDDESCWREIARANQIMNPLNVPVGQQLKVPALHL